MRIIVSDANIWIDILEAGLVDIFFQLPFEFHTTALVFAEVNSSQRGVLDVYVSTNQLLMNELDFPFISQCNEVVLLNNSLSLPDASVYLCALDLGGIVLTGDKPLRKWSKEKGVETHGILWIFDKWLEFGTLEPLIAASHLEVVMKMNSRLPLDECKKRLKEWGNIELKEDFI